MRRSLCAVSVLVILCAVAFSLGGATGAAAQVRVDVRFGPPPPMFINAPPPMVVIPGTYVYTVADPGIDILFYNGYWFRPHEGRWFRSRAYNGPWAFVPPRQVPGVIVNLPPKQDW